MCPQTERLVFSKAKKTTAVKLDRSVPIDVVGSTSSDEGHSKVTLLLERICKTLRLPGVDTGNHENVVRAILRSLNHTVATHPDIITHTLPLIILSKASDALPFGLSKKQEALLRQIEDSLYKVCFHPV
jgi:hypothetical protein